MFLAQIFMVSYVLGFYDMVSGFRKNIFVTSYKLLKYIKAFINLKHSKGRDKTMKPTECSSASQSFKKCFTCKWFTNNKGTISVSYSVRTAST